MSDGAAGQRLRVLLLEDSRFDAELLREALLASYPQADLQWVRDEDAFLAALVDGVDHGLDLVLSDYQLGGFSGDQALQHARTIAPELPFIFVSGVIGEDNAVELLKRGATDYVSKGRLARLPVVIERALREVAERQARREVESKLQEADALYARVVDSLKDYAVILLDPEGRIRSWTRAAQAIFGHDEAAAIGQSAALLFTPADRQARVFERELVAAVTDGSASDDRWLQRADGSRLWAQGVTTPVLGVGGVLKGYSKIVRDATAQHLAAEDLRRAKDEAERANAAKDRFLAVLSHELRTPLAPIASAAHLLERAQAVPERFARLLPMIRRNVELEARLIDDLLDLTRITSGKIHLRTAPVDMHAVIRSVLEMVEGDIRAKGVQLAVMLGATHSTVHGDEARLQQVVWNVVRNAVKFSEQGGRIEIRSAVSDDGRGFELRCSDSGIGILPDALARIFEPFEQAGSDVTRQFGGLGLGLAIAKGLLQEHAGTISAHSEGRGQGATFTLRLPLLTDRVSDALQAPDGIAAVGPRAHHRVLLVEDNADAAESLQLSLETYGYEVQHAATLADALALLRSSRFDAVVTDIGLPDGSGIELGNAAEGRVPVIALSGYGTHSDRRDSELAGFAGHLVKPADPAEVHALVERILAETR